MFLQNPNMSCNGGWPLILLSLAGSVRLLINICFKTLISLSAF